VIFPQLAPASRTDCGRDGTTALRHPCLIKSVLEAHHPIALIGFDRSRGGQAVFAEGISLKRFHGV